MTEFYIFGWNIPTPNLFFVH